MQKLDTKMFLTGHCSFDMAETVNSLRKLVKVWSWGARGWTVMNSYCLRFRVSGHHHKGYIYLVVNDADLFDVYYTNLKNEIKHVSKNVFIGDLVDTIDEKVEKIPQYRF